jgi:cytochrome oxidase Cu insertion factor (SCO1/SenC/PrrC family)
MRAVTYDAVLQALGAAQMEKGTSRMARSPLSLVTGLLLGGLLAAAALASTVDSFRPLPPDQRRPVPTFSLLDHQGNALSSAELQGKVVVVRFWATW